MTDHPRRRYADPHPPKQAWHLDKSVPIGLIIAILFQTAAAVWFIATLSARVTTLELSADRTAMPRLAVVESKLSDIKEAIGRIENRLSGRQFP